MENDKKNSNGVNKIGAYVLYGGAVVFVIFLIYIIFISDRKSQPINTELNVQKNNIEAIDVQRTEPAEKIQLYLFHSTNRCYSCITAGEYAKKILNQNFSQELESGKIEFREINVDLSENKDVANKFKAAGTALFINSIIDGKDNIKEDTQIWRLVSNEKSFSDYLAKKLEEAIGEKVSAQENLKMEKEDIVFYVGEDCSDCANIQKYLEDNNAKNKIAFAEKNIVTDEAGAQQMGEDALYCNIDVDLFGVPFLWADGKCYTEEKEIINFFGDKLKS